LTAASRSRPHGAPALTRPFGVGHLECTDVDSGTAAEIGYAAAIHTPVVGLRTDTRLSSDNEGSVVNLQVEHFSRLSGGELVFDLGDAVRELDRVCRQSSQG
jgi:nucleoside 2-deoxyribosyltransferase